MNFFINLFTKIKNYIDIKLYISWLNHNTNYSKEEKADFIKSFEEEIKKRLNKIEEENDDKRS